MYRVGCVVIAGSLFSGVGGLAAWQECHSTMIEGRVVPAEPKAYAS